MARWRIEVVGMNKMLAALGRIEWLLRANLMVNQEQTERIVDMAGEMEALQGEVAENTSVTQSAVSLMNGLSQQLKDALANNDPQAVQAVINQLDQNTNSLAEAITQNTSAEGNGGGEQQ